MLRTLSSICLLLTIVDISESARYLEQRSVTELPSLTLAEGKAEKTLSASSGKSNLWVTDNGAAYYSPPASLVALSQNISDYYYAVGSQSALTDDLIKHRVGGRGRTHIFYLPEGPGGFHGQPSTPIAKGRSGSLSELRRLEQGADLAVQPYRYRRDQYRDPLDRNGRYVEMDVMRGLTEASYRKYLVEMTDPRSNKLKVPSRNWDDAASTRAVVNFLKTDFEGTGLTTCVQNFVLSTGRQRRSVSNVIAFVPGATAGSVTMGAHFDDLPARGSAPGAVDNGSGVAAVLAMAKAFAEAGARPLKSIYFVAFGGEEAGLYGSDRFAQELSQPGSTNSPIPAQCRTSPSTDHSAIIMDMIGWRNPRFPADTVTLETKTWSASLLPHLAWSNQVNNGDKLNLMVSYNPYGSDHESYLQRKLKAALIIDNDGDAEAYPCYHKSCDRIENVNIRLATEISKMNLGALMRLSGLRR